MADTVKNTNDEVVIDEIIAKSDVIRLAMFDGNEPYIVPLNFGCKINGNERVFYMHCANVGRKLDILKKFPKVCFELDTDHELIKAPKACGWTMHFKSVIGTGKVEIVTSAEDKEEGLRVLMSQYDKSEGEKEYDFSKHMNQTSVLRLKVERISSKVKGA